MKRSRHLITRLTLGISRQVTPLRLPAGCGLFVAPAEASRWEIVFFGCCRYAQGVRQSIGYARPVCPLSPSRRRPAVLPPSLSPPSTRNGFTLVELLIVIGLLGAVAMVLMGSFNISRKQTLDESIVQKELSDIQRAFHRMNADCVLGPDDYEHIARYGLALLMQREVGTAEFDEWDADRGRGWRGPYLVPQGQRSIDPEGVGQPEGGTKIPVIETPHSRSDADPSFYRVVATQRENGEHKVVAPTENVDQLWVISPNSGEVPEVNDSIEEFPHPFRRRLLLERD